jgi:hypothetical protein
MCGFVRLRDPGPRTTGRVWTAWLRRLGATLDHGGRYEPLDAGRRRGSGPRGTRNSAVGFGSGSEITQPETLTVNQRGGNIQFVKDKPAKDNFMGDEVTVNGPVYDASGTNKIGHQHAVCTLFDKKGVRGECSIATFLTQGAIMVTSPVHFGVNDRTRGAITGGTGKYRNARGQVIFINSDTDTEGFIFQREP